MHADDERELRELAADYELGGELGRGSSAVVYRARDRALEREVAVKLVRAGRVDAELLERSAQEARLLARLPHHPNLVAIYAVRRLSRGSVALVMQYVPGPTLREVLARDGALPVERATRVLLDLGRALHFAHEHGIVHRDVKPENVYLDEGTGRALLSDFGSAVLLDRDARRTRPGSVIGTPAYMSPEQIAGEAVDGRSDVYSLGLVGWEVLTGRFPWGTSNLYEILYRQRYTDLPLVDEVRPGLPTPLVNAVERALLRDRAARWPDAAAFLAALLASPGVARVPRREVRTPVPSELPTSEVGDQHARTLQVDAPRGDGDATPGAAARPAAPGASRRDAPVAVPSAAGPAPVPSAAAWSADRLRATLREAEAEQRRSSRRGALLAAGLLLLVVAVAGGFLLGDRRDAWLARLDGLGWPGGAERQAAGEVALEDDLVTDLAAAARALPADGGDTGAAAPAASPDELRAAATGSGIDARCATPGLPNQRACLLARLIDHDAELNRVYGELVRALRQEAGVADGSDPPAVQELRVAQRRWLVERDEACAREGRGREGELWAESRARCLGERGQVRADELARRLADVRAGP